MKMWNGFSLLMGRKTLKWICLEWNYEENVKGNPWDWHLGTLAW
jgi:hypothetical protein